MQNRKTEEQNKKYTQKQKQKQKRGWDREKTKQTKIKTCITIDIL